MKDFEQKFQERFEFYMGDNSQYSLVKLVKDWVLSNLPTGGAEEILKSYKKYEVIKRDAEGYEDGTVEAITLEDATKAIKIATYQFINNKDGAEEILEELEKSEDEQLKPWVSKHTALKAILRAENARLTDDLDAAKTTIYRQRTWVTSLEGTIRQLNAENNQLIEDCADINTEKAKDFLKETNKLEAENADLRRQALDIVTENAALKAEIDRLKGENVDTKPKEYYDQLTKYDKFSKNKKF